METLRDQILTLSDRPVFKTENVPVWGFPVFVRTISANEKLWLYGRVKNGFIPYADLACVGLGNAAGERLFNEQDIEQLGDKNPIALEFVGEAVLCHNRMRPDDVRNAEKNSATIPNSSGS